MGFIALNKTVNSNATYWNGKANLYYNIDFAHGNIKQYFHTSKTQIRSHAIGFYNSVVIKPISGRPGVL